ncbi:MAG: zinc-ribbon domain-containing protein [Spirochaetaceae bacterium]|nr:zinc-ribbon domain-containing protein [Spirochaetaceae bacterium]
MYCTSCGNKLDEDSVFCSKCGSHKDSTDKYLYCENCGSKINNDAAFCTECGTPIPEKILKSRKLQEEKVPKEDVIAVIAFIIIIMLAIIAFSY